MARPISVRWMRQGTSGRIYYGKRDASGRFSRAGNAVEFLKEELPLFDSQMAGVISNNLNSMASSFLRSYTVGGNGNDKIPQWTGNLADSTSILVYKGKELAGCHTQNPFLATKAQHWDGVKQGFGKEYVKMDKANDASVRQVQSRLEPPEFGDVNISAVLYVAIPYAEITNESGTPSKTDNKRGWFTSMAADFMENCIQAAGRVEGIAMQGSAGELISQAVKRISR